MRRRDPPTPSNGGSPGFENPFGKLAIERYEVKEFAFHYSTSREKYQDRDAGRGLKETKNERT
jgi:hypothetical protein